MLPGILAHEFDQERLAWRIRAVAGPIPYRLTPMRRGRLLRQRYRDESMVAALMDFPRTLFILAMVVVAAVALLIEIAIDILLRTPMS